MSIRDKDRGYKELVRRVYGLKSPVIKVGVLKDDGAEEYDDGLRVIQVAIWNEFGAGHVPERSFIRAWFDENQAKCRAAFKRLMTAVVAGKYTKSQALELLAQRFVGEIQKRMAQGVPPPNAPSTIRQKGSDKPLIDTGQLRSSISYSIDGKAFPSKALIRRRKERERQAAKDKLAKARLRAAQKKALIRKLRGLRQGAKLFGKNAAKFSKRALRNARKGSRKALRAGTRASKRVLRNANRFGKRVARKARRAARKVKKAVT